MKSELKRRNLSALGPKAQLVARLKPHLDAVIAAAEGTPAAAAAKVVRNSKYFISCQDKNNVTLYTFSFFKIYYKYVWCYPFSAGVVGISRANLNSISVNSPSTVIIKEESNVKPIVANIIVRQQGKFEIFIIILPIIFQEN